MRHLGIDARDLADGVDNTVDISDAALSLTEHDDRPSFVIEVALPKGFTPLVDGRNTAYWRLIQRMAERKHLEIDDFEKAGVGYTRESPFWEPFAIFPIVEWGKTVYYQGRLYGTKLEGMKGTKKFPSKRLLPVGASNWVYNIDEARACHPKTIVVVESILNVLSFEKEARRCGLTPNDVVAVAVFKHAISKIQLKKIFSINSATEVSMLFDSDAMISSWETAENLSAFKNVTVCSMPDGVDANDDAVQALKAFSNRRPLDDANYLAAKLQYNF
jgi:hypothetical protein